MLLQLIGPNGSELRRRLCPKAVNIDSSLHNSLGFNDEMEEAPGYWFEEATDQKCLDKLEAWMCEPVIEIHSRYSESIFTKNPGIWIYEGSSPIDVTPTMVWRIGIIE